MSLTSVLVFTNTKHRANRVAEAAERGEGFPPWPFTATRARAPGFWR